ncbi:MAG TPA: DUF177 domain-containing protein [Bacteroidales bacterium]|nr:DUF177 domain-containing protein [Bacteroidales bacterium]HNZ43232.1 DUF177 domain-containing protein [Bacteroidales bacterium]HOH83152.1 DUF177 domain-containing protein [Bacteroidales bacterium]HPB25944.1 DUF177 domain-containing protein [Bacteroidales bacterium]HPI30768.1 DUF177 domain-containing protein [Bacteroidales bacterium]
MSYQDRYILEFAGLSDGMHHFEFTVDGNFFREYDYEDIQQCNILVLLDMNKQPDMLELKMNFSGTIVCECDRCLEKYDQPVAGNERLIVKFGDEDTEPADDIIMLPPQENKVDLSQFFYETIILLLPQRRVHPEDENGKSNCNPDIIKKLEELNQQKKNNDPRWDELKKITFKN